MRRKSPRTARHRTRSVDNIRFGRATSGHSGLTFRPARPNRHHGVQQAGWFWSVKARFPPANQPGLLQFPRMAGCVTC